MRLELEPPDLAQAAAQTVAGHSGRLKLRNDQSHPRVARRVIHPDHVQMLEAAAASLRQAPPNVRRAREPVGSREARRGRQEPPCFDGSETVSCFRPFFRRRERTARPHRVAMRARKPCLLIRRLLRGRYDGFMRAFLQSEPGNLVMGRVQVKLERAESAETGSGGETSLSLKRWPSAGSSSPPSRHHLASIATADPQRGGARISFCQARLARV